jgi:hypothetical protein
MTASNLGISVGLTVFPTVQLQHCEILIQYVANLNNCGVGCTRITFHRIVWFPIKFLSLTFHKIGLVSECVMRVCHACTAFR